MSPLGSKWPKITKYAVITLTMSKMAILDVLIILKVSFLHVKFFTFFGQDSYPSLHAQNWARTLSVHPQSLPW